MQDRNVQSIGILLFLISCGIVSILFTQDILTNDFLQVFNQPLVTLKRESRTVDEFNANIPLESQDPVFEVEEIISRINQNYVWALDYINVRTTSQTTASSIIQTSLITTRSPAELHRLFVKELSDNDKEMWVRKIWQTKRLESHEHEQPIQLLYWTAQNDRHDMDLQFGNNNKICGPCHLTVDKSKIKSADAVIINNSELMLWQKNVGLKYEPVPESADRLQRQFWVFEGNEAKEWGSRGNDQPLLFSPEHDRAFNLTITGNSDSDVSRIYNDIENAIRVARYDTKTGLVQVNDDAYLRGLMQEKETSVYNTAWFVSNCGNSPGAKKRMDFAKDLIKAGLRLHAEGECFDNITPRFFGKTRKSTAYPISTLKFYLSFESVYHCNDIISEKFWRNAIAQDLVPVVFGPKRADIEKVAPPNSLIFAEDFYSAKELVEYLEFLDQNDDAYLEYHQWKNLYRQKDTVSVDETLQRMGSDKRTYCELCRKIRTMRKNNIHQTYQSVMKFWAYDTHPECRELKSFQAYQKFIRSEDNVQQWSSL